MLVPCLAPVLGLALGLSPEPASATVSPEEGAVEAETTSGAEEVAVHSPEGTAPEPSAETSPTEPAETDAEPSPTGPAETAETDVEPSPTEPTGPTETDVEAGPTEPAPAPRTYPRLVVAGGPMVGPHAFGNEKCDSDLAECQTKGAFLGLGGQVELRGRLWRPLYLHVRGLAAKNISPNDPVYSGVLGAGAGVGAYAKRIFGRAEYQYVHAMGDNHFEPPFFDGEVATDEWGRHAGMVTVGFRQPLPHHLAVELWGGLMIGPRSVRTIAQEEPEQRNLVTFQVGLNLAWDAWR